MNRDASFVIVCVVLHLLVGVLIFPGAGTDDCFITYQAVDRLIETGRFENLNGQPVEISSSLAHVLVLALLRLLTPGSTYWVGLAVSVLCGACMILCTWWISSRVSESREVAWTATLTAALHGPLLYWSWSGLETTFSAVCVTIFAGLAVRHMASTEDISGPFCRACFVVAGTAVFLARPEGFVVVGAILGYLFVAFLDGDSDRLKYTRAWCGLTGSIGIMVLFVTIWRWRSFERLLPNPVYAKTSGLAGDKIAKGVAYGVESLTTPTMLALFLAPVFVVALVAIWRFDSDQWAGVQVSLREPWRIARAMRHSPSALVGTCVVAYGATVIAAGGDWMPHARFLVHVLPLVLCLGSGAIWALLKILSPRGRQFPVYLVLFLVIAVSVAESAWVSPVRERRCLWNLDLRSGMPFTTAFQSLNVGNRRDLELLLPFLRPAVQTIIAEKGSACLLTGQMGFIPYVLYQEFGNHVRFVDRRGLTEPELTRLVDLPRFQWGLGINFADIADHTLVADRQDDIGLAVQYIWDREPDIVYGLWFRPARFGAAARAFGSRGFRVTQFADVRSVFPTRDTSGELVFVLEASSPTRLQ